MRTLLVAVCLAALSAGPGVAQSSTDDMMAQMERMQATQEAAAAAANHPGDEALTCDQLMSEMASTMDTPEMHAYAESTGQQAQAMQDRAGQARERAMANVGVNLVVGFASSFIPGAGFAQMALMNQQNAQMQRDMQDSQANMMAMMANLEPMMPAMMRGQRIYELAQAQNCEFLQAPPEGAAPPTDE